MPAWRPDIAFSGLKINLFLSHETPAVKSTANAGATTAAGVVPGAR